MTVGRAQTAVPAVRPLYAQWHYLVTVAVVLGFVLSQVMPFLNLPAEAFPFTIPAAIATLLVELSAMIPQTLLTAHGWKKTSSLKESSSNDPKKRSSTIEDSTYENNVDVSGSVLKTPLALVIRRWEASTQPHFVGFLCLGRVFRLLFWLITVANMWALTHEGDWALVFTLVIPETIHCVLFGDFLMHWLHKIKNSAVDPFVNQVSVIL